MKIKAIIFDLDGTLVDTIEDIGDAANVLFRRHGYPEHSKKEYLRWIGNGAANFVSQGLGIELHEERLIAYVEEFKEIYMANYANKSCLFPGIEEMLNALVEKSVKLAILSNKPHHLTVKVTDSFLSNWNIDPVFGQRDKVERKPDPAAALEIAEIMHVPPGEILFVGDSEGDIKTAMAAGMIPVGVSWGYGNKAMTESLNYQIINKPDELLNLLY